jgi:hypothetical protein
VKSIDLAVLMQATPDNVLIATWHEYGSNYNAMAQARLDRNGSVVWASRQDSSNVLWPCCLSPLVDGSSAWLAWRSTMLSSTDHWFLASWPSRITADAGRFHVSATVFGAPYPDDARQFNHLQYAEFDAGLANLATGITQIRRFALDGVTSPSLVNPIVFDDRVLLLTDDGGTLKPVVVWR